MEQECQKSLIQGKIHIQQNSSEDLEHWYNQVLEKYVVQNCLAYVFLIIQLFQWVKKGKYKKGRLWARETFIFEIIFVTLS